MAGAIAANTTAPEQSRDPTAIAAVIAALAAAFGNRLVTSQAVREQHGNTLTWVPNQPPDAVVFPQTTEDVQQIVRICASRGVAMIPFGTGTSLEGHVNAPLGGVSIDPTGQCRYQFYPTSTELRSSHVRVGFQRLNPRGPRR